MISPSQRPLPYNTQHSQQTNIHAPGGIRTHNLSGRAAEDLRLRPRGHWDRLLFFVTPFNCNTHPHIHRHLVLNLVYNSPYIEEQTHYRSIVKTWKFFSHKYPIFTRRSTDFAVLYFWYEYWQKECGRKDFTLNNQPDALIIQIYPVIKLYVFRASSLHIIWSFLLYIRHW